MKKQNYLVGILLGILLVSGGIGISQVVSVSNTVSGRELPISSVETGKKQVALTFDAMWEDDGIQEILEILKKHEVKATFFLTGDWVEKYPDKVKQIWKTGHDLGNHSETHRTMSQLSEKECKEELQSVHKKVKKITGVEMNLFRVPYSDYDDKVIKAAAECGYQTIEWSVNSLDWKEYGAEAVVQTVLEHDDLKKGAIILMHSSAKYTTAALETIIVGLQEMGYQIVPVTELVLRENYKLDVTGRQFRK